MKKISKIALVAVVAAMTAFFGCNSEPSILEKVAPVSDLQAKAFPGLNVVTWKPNAVSNGYTLFADYGRGWEFVDDFDNDACSHYDFISTDNEWANGQEVKYMIQNDGDKLARAAYVNKELVSSDFVEVSVKAVNPGYKAEVMYKMPALEEGQATPDFNSVDYFDAEAIAAFVDPAFTIKEREPKAPLVTFVKAPGLQYSLTVRSADETEKIDFAFNEDDTELSALGNAELITPFIGQNDVWVTIYDVNDYYSPVEYKIGSFTNTVEGAAAAWNAQFAMARDTDEEEADVYKLTWNAITVDNVKSLDGVYYLYSEISADPSSVDNWEKVEFTYSYDELIGKYVAYLPFNKKEVNKTYKLFAVYNGKTVGSAASSDYVDRATPYVNNGLDLQYVVTEKYDIDTTDAEDLKNAKIILAWKPVTRFAGKVATDVTYKITKQEYDFEKGELKDEEITSVGTVNAYNSYNDCIATAPFDVKNNRDTTYRVYAYDPEGNLIYRYVDADGDPNTPPTPVPGSYVSEKQYTTDLTSKARPGSVAYEKLSDDKKSVTFKGETSLDFFGKEVVHTYKLFVIDASLNTGILNEDLRAAKEVPLSATYEAVEDQSYRKVTLTASGLNDKVTYKYWLFDVTKQEEGLPASAYRSGTFN